MLHVHVCGITCTSTVYSMLEEPQALYKYLGVLNVNEVCNITEHGSLNPSTACSFFIGVHNFGSW